MQKILSDEKYKQIRFKDLKASTARELALKVLLAVHVNEAYANIALTNALRANNLSKEERRFATELVYGTIKATGTINWILAKYLQKPLECLEVHIREILLLGIYQLFFMPKIPVHAVCDEMVKLAKKYAPKNLSALVNAVLRTAIREPERGSLPDENLSQAENLALFFQHPLWLVKKWIVEYGFSETEKICAFNNEAATLTLRTNTLKISPKDLEKRLRHEGLKVASSIWSHEGILCLEHDSLDRLKALQEGFCQIQDESSMQVSHVLGVKAGDLVLDVCAAPGGKTTHIAELMGNKGRIIALDIHQHKLKLIQENARRLGINIIDTLACDARNLPTEFLEMMDCVLVDAPCSGLGVLRRKADARWRKKPTDLEFFPKLQSAILISAAKTVKRGGTLVYSTCTMEKGENQAVVENFLREKEDFYLDATGSFLPIKKMKEKMVSFYPPRDKIDGFFIARLKRKGS